MKFFEAVPGDLFSPLASPNRGLYADALDVLYAAYRENLKIREDTLYSMLRGRLEQQLSDATFEGEDIDEEELRDISGRARFLIRKLCGKGWFEKERGDDFQEYITVPGYSSRLLELFHQLRDDSPVRGYSYVFDTYSSLKVAYESDVVYDKMAAVYSAYEKTGALINLLQMVYHNVKHYFQMQIDMQEVNQMLYDVFSTEWIFREGEEARVDFTQSGIADQLELQQKTCEQLTSALGHTFHIEEEVLEPRFFPGVSVTILDIGRGSYRIDIIAPRVQMVDGRLDYCMDRGYTFVYRYDPFVLRWQVVWPQNH